MDLLIFVRKVYRLVDLGHHLGSEFAIFIQDFVFGLYQLIACVEVAFMGDFLHVNLDIEPIDT